MKSLTICNTVFLILLVLFGTQSANAQIVQDFSSSAWPYAGWVGNTERFTTASQQLRIVEDTVVLNSYTAKGYRFSASDLQYPLQYDFDVQTAVPSANNSVTIWLWSDSADVDVARNALYIGFSNKKPVLYQKINGTNTAVITLDTIADYELLRMTVTHTPANVLAFTVKYCNRTDGTLRTVATDTTNYALPAVVNPANFGYFGLRFRYSSSYWKRFYFDNVNVRALLPDVNPPSVRSALFSYTDENTDYIDVVFDEPVDSASAVNMNNYRVVTMDMASQAPLFNGTLLEENIVQLAFSKLTPNMLHTLRVCNVKDIIGNQLTACDTALVKWNPSDYTNPVANEAAAKSERTVLVKFNESMDSISSLKLDNYVIDGNNPTSAEYRGKSVLLTFPITWREFDTTDITVSGVYDLSGNILDTVTLKFVLDTTYMELIINEILFNPRSGGGDFVEIYNRSGRDIKLGDIMLGTWDDEANSFKTACRISDTAVIASHDYLVVTTDTALTKKYTVLNPEKLICLKSMPSYSDAAGTVVIALRDTSTIIDRFSYSEKMHSAFLKDREGVSLERRSFTEKTQLEANWHSASKSAGWATPTYKNSQSYDFLFADDDIAVDPQVFSPDNDGYNDEVNISYSFKNGDYTGNVFVYDAQGRLVKRLERNAILGYQGVFKWDGTAENGNRCQIGNYVVFVEVFNASGTRQAFKKVVTLMLK